jgi:hypothetical protein
MMQPNLPSPASTLTLTLTRTHNTEGMMQLSLPSPASTNGTYLQMQAVHSIVKSMITREYTWYGKLAISNGFVYLALLFGFKMLVEFEARA